MFHSHSSFGLPTQQNVAVVHTKSTFEKYWPNCLASKCLSIWRKLHRSHQWFCACVLLHIHCRFKLVTMPPLWHHKCSHHMNLQYSHSSPGTKTTQLLSHIYAMPNPSAKAIGMFRYFGVSHSTAAIYKVIVPVLDQQLPCPCDTPCANLNPKSWVSMVAPLFLQTYMKVFTRQ